MYTRRLARELHPVDAHTAPGLADRSPSGEAGRLTFIDHRFLDRDVFPPSLRPDRDAPTRVAGAGTPLTASAAHPGPHAVRALDPQREYEAERWADLKRDAEQEMEAER